MGDQNLDIEALFAHQNEVLKEVADAVKTVGTSMTADKLHGTNGLLSTPGLERDVITAHVRPYGIASALPLFPSVTEDPRFPSITGFTADTGSEPTEACADAPSAFMKGANLTAQFGLARRDTNTIDIGKTMLQVNRGEMRDLQLRGRLLGLTDLAANMNEQGMLNVLTKSEMVIAGVSLERKLVKDIWQSTAGKTSFPGLDVQIATGQKDADSGVAAPALDSDIKDFGFDLIGGTGRDIVEYLSSMMWYLQYNAQQMGLDPVSWALVMRPELWFELSAIWPIVYNTNRANTTPTKATVFIDGRQDVTERDAMRQGLYLDVNGIRYPVILDVGIYEHTNVTTASLKAGEYASSIYAVPLTITGGMPVTYREYLNYGAASQDMSLLQGNNLFWTDGGMYLWAIQQINYCYKLAVRTEQRVILRTPQLAGKLQKVKYVPLQHLRTTDPLDPYFKDGGVSLRGWTPGQAIWK